MCIGVLILLIVMSSDTIIWLRSSVDHFRYHGDLFLDMIYKKLGDPLRQKNLTCVHARRGDKARSWNKGSHSIYNPWALSLEFYVKALEHAR